jgi:hypothetical protein
MIFNSDDFWVYRQMKKNASRMHVLSIRDLTPAETHQFLRGTHANHFPEAPPVTLAESAKIWDLIGGRMSYLGRLAKHANMIEAAEDMISSELEWLHHRLGLIPGQSEPSRALSRQSDFADARVGSSLGDLCFQTTMTMSWTNRNLPVVHS